MAKKIMKNPHKVIPQMIAAVIGSWGYFCLGNLRGWSSPGIPSLNATLHEPSNTPNSSDYFEMTDNDLSWISSLPPLVAIFGSLFIIAPMQIFGRKKALIGLSIPGIVGFLLMGFTVYVRHKWILYFGRILTGLLGGATTPASQIYITECSSPRVRGILGSLTASFLALGILVSYIIGAFVEWYVLCWILACFPLVLLIGIMFWPETPVWLLAHDREDDARKSLQRLRGKRTPVEAELQRIKQNQEKTKQNGVQQKIKPRELMKGFVLKPLGLSMGIMFFQQYTGINAVVYYTVSIFQSAGSTMEPRFAAIIVGFVQFVFTAISGLFVDRFGRRILLLASGFIVTLSMAAMGTFFYYQRLWGEEEATATLGWLPLVSLMVFFASYSSGYASVPFILMGELLPARYRSILGPISSSFNLLCTFSVVRGFPALKESIGADATFWLFMISTFISLFYIYFLIPETKGKTLEEIERMFSKKTTNEMPMSPYWTVQPRPTSTVQGLENPSFAPNDTPFDSKDKEGNDNSDSDDEDGSVVVAPY